MQWVVNPSTVNIFGRWSNTLDEVAICMQSPFFSVMLLLTPFS